MSENPKKSLTPPILVDKPGEENQLSPNPAGFGFTKQIFVDSLPVSGEVNTLYAKNIYNPDGSLLGYLYYTWSAQGGFAYAPFSVVTPNTVGEDGGRSQKAVVVNPEREMPEKVYNGIVVFKKEPYVRGMILSEYVDKHGGVTHAELEAAIAGKVDKVAGMGLSHNDYSDTEKDKVANTIDKRTLSLGLHTDGLLYIFDNGVPIGVGVALPSGDVVGNIDSGNVLVLSGNLPDGTYTAKYEMEDGSLVVIGELVLDTNVYRSITNNLTECTNSNSAVSIIDGESYSATISANEGYEISSLVVTMGGIDITSTAVSGGNISIAEVTGNIVITAVAEAMVEPTNFFVVGGDGYLNPGRASSKGEDRTDVTTCLLSNYIEVQNGDEIYAYGAKSSNADVGNMGLYQSDKTGVGFYVRTTASDPYLDNVSLSDEVDIFTITYEGATYMRVCCLIPTDLSIIKINIKRNGEWL
jgi:hypothetical protein